MRRSVLLFLVFAISTGISAIEPYGVFFGLRLVFDANLDTGYDSVTTHPVPRAGQTVTIQLFVPDAGGKQSLGYQVEFALAGKDILEHLELQGGTTWDGTQITVRKSESLAAALLLNAPSYSSSGFLGTISFRVKKDLSDGDALIASSASIGNLLHENDALDISTAFLAFSNRVELIDGDFDLDGDVDFNDFLKFTQNFGRTGPVPTPPAPLIRVVTVQDTIVETQIDTVITVQYDTTYVTVRDTIEITKTDTVYFATDESPQRQRAELLLGFWTFHYRITILWDDNYLMGDIRPDPDDPDGELYVFGSDEFRELVAGTYAKDLEEYIILDTGTILNQVFVFKIQGSRAVGKVYLYEPDEDLSQASIFDLTSDSGRSDGGGFLLSKPTSPLVSQTQKLASIEKQRASKSTVVPQAIIEAHNRLKNVLERAK